MANTDTEEIPYEDRTIPELKRFAAERDIEIDSDAKKDDIIKALEKADKADSKSAPKKDADKGDVKGHLTIKGSESADTRLFQTSPYIKEWLTQAEAEAKGHYWRDTEKLGKA